MPFKKVNPNKEIEKAITNTPELVKEIAKADKEYENAKTEGKKINCYKGQEGCLRFIGDILDDYDGCNTVASLKLLIDEVRNEVINGIIQKDNYSK